MDKIETNEGRTRESVDWMRKMRKFEPMDKKGSQSFRSRQRCCRRCCRHRQTNSGGLRWNFRSNFGVTKKNPPDKATDDDHDRRWRRRRSWPRWRRWPKTFEWRFNSAGTRLCSECRRRRHRQDGWRQRRCCVRRRLVRAVLQLRKLWLPSQRVRSRWG